ncbi:hypothetical protein [Paracraurococcus lichenis]|uniref:Uncharacterized protein n=1 Tax=Paracraurococcus lichenis TaxID=3064888 RepID=A0ABT9E2Y8_9PROT|nr:hypothetical protein [Paracraurococcus sp. LOR1-02]MDO9710530.1 hypothetical protein [Paracraurococcus sp. LOR1-02]
MDKTDKLVPLDDAALDLVGGGGASLALATKLVTADYDGPLCGTRYPGWVPIPIPGPGPGPILTAGTAI